MSFVMLMSDFLTQGWGLVVRTNLRMTGLEPSIPSPPPQPQGQQRAWRLNPRPMASDLINHAYVVKPP